MFSDKIKRKRYSTAGINYALCSENCCSCQMHLCLFTRVNVNRRAIEENLHLMSRITIDAAPYTGLAAIQTSLQHRAELLQLQAKYV